MEVGQRSRNVLVVLDACSGFTPSSSCMLAPSRSDGLAKTSEKSAFLSLATNQHQQHTDSTSSI